MGKKFDNLVKFGVLIFLLEIVLFFFINSGENIVLGESVLKVLGATMVALVTFMLFDWLANCINTIRLGNKSDDKGMVFLGYKLLVFPLIEFAAIGTFYLLGIPEESLVVIPITFFIGVPLLLLTDENPLRGNNWFKLSYYVLFIIIPLILVQSMQSPRVSYSIGAKVKATMDQMRAAAELYKIRNEQEDYSGVEGDDDMARLIVSVNEATKGNDALLLSPDKAEWCFKVDWSRRGDRDKIHCVDSAGYAGVPGDQENDCNVRTGDYSCR
jgi:hypothetical protein